MDEADAGFTLVRDDLMALENAIRGLDTILFQGQGWSVAAVLAAAGTAATSGRLLLIWIGYGAKLDSG